METTTKTAKSYSIGLKSHGTTMRIVAMRRPDNTAMTFVTATDADKKTTRGMTEQHADWDTAKAAVVAMATKAQKLGWEKGSVGFRPRPDAFATLPVPPKAKR